jgi:hypothetical protein
MRKLGAVLVGAITAVGIGLASRAGGRRGMPGVVDAVGRRTRCDGPIDPSGFFQRCDSGGALGFATPPMCYRVDANNLGNNMPRIGP